MVVILYLMQLENVTSGWRFRVELIAPLLGVALWNMYWYE